MRFVDSLSALKSRSNQDRIFSVFTDTRIKTIILFWPLKSAWAESYTRCHFQRVYMNVLPLRSDANFLSYICETFFFKFTGLVWKILPLNIITIAGDVCSERSVWAQYTDFDS